MTLKNKIKLMKGNPKSSRDGMYDYLVGEAGLYGIAFFGHKGTKAQKAKLRYIWKQVMLYA